jgi:hypothetical protein
MTVIAWDGTTLAADKQANYAGVALTVTKVFRLDNDRLAAICGCGAHGMAILDWLRDNGDLASYPRPNGDDQVALVLVVHRTGEVWYYEYGGYRTPLHESVPLAMGAGRDAAMGALRMGADAKRAVEVANALCTDCGQGVDTLRFEP